jgi:hypothetical protein
MKKVLFFCLFYFLNLKKTIASDLDIVIGQGYVDNLSNVLNSSLQLIFIVASLISFFFLIAAGIKWISSGGNQGKIDEARNQIIASVVGLLILSSSWAIINFTLSLLNIDDGLSGLLASVPTLVAKENTQEQLLENSDQSRNNLYHNVLDTSANKKDWKFFYKNN